MSAPAPVEQLPLPLRLDDPLPSLGQFEPAGNEEALAQLEARIGGRAWQPLLLHGPPGSGKTHLLSGAAHALLQAGRPTRLLPLARLHGYAPEQLGLDGVAADVLLLDDLDAVLGRRDWELALFALLNRAHDQHLPLVASASAELAELPFALPDLRSRFGQGTQVALQPLDEAQRRAVLLRRAAERGLELPASLVDWLHKHWSRDLGRLLGLLDQLDRISLSRSRKLTIPLVRAHLQSLAEPGAPPP